MDLRLARGLADIEDLEDETTAVQAQAARLSEVCRVWAPAYRQVTFGTYLKKERKAEPCFDAAYADVEAAFDHFLSEVDGDFVLVGHSQGAQITSRLLSERFDEDPALRERLVAAYPIGWGIGVASGSTTGGSSEEVPVCTSEDERGCIVAFKTFLSGHDSPGQAFLEGDEMVCVEPKADEVLAASMFHNDDFYAHPQTDAEFVVYREAYTAGCTGSPAALEVAWRGEDDRDNPVPWDSGALTGNNASHVLDMAFSQGDIALDVLRRR